MMKIISEIYQTVQYFWLFKVYQILYRCYSSAIARWDNERFDVQTLKLIDAAIY